MADVRRHWYKSVNYKCETVAEETVEFLNAGTLYLYPFHQHRASRANEPVTVTLEISGRKYEAIRNRSKFPPISRVMTTVTNNFQVTTNGLTGSRKIDYLAIPRYEGNYEIPPVEFSYFDPNSHSYKTLKSPAYSLQIAKGDPSKVSASSYVNQQNVRVEQDIRFLKTGEPQYHYRDSYFVGTTGYWLWYLLPLLGLILFYLFNRKMARENADVARMRTRKANKMAIRRLKLAEKFLKEHNKEKFYDEVLRALWGYFSDKLSIPVASLTKDNIEKELSDYGVEQTLIDRFMRSRHL